MIGIVLIIWSTIPNKARDWAEEWAKKNVQLILPDRMVTPKHLERELRWHKVKNKISKIIRLVFSNTQIKGGHNEKRNNRIYHDNWRDKIK